MDDFATVGFQAEKAAQVAAFFVGSSENKTIDKVHLMKLIYLAERDFIIKHREPMLYDELYCLEFGPVCLSTLDGVNGGGLDIWQSYIKLTDKMVVSSTKKYSREDLDELSDVEFSSLEEVWASFGWMSKAEVINYTHSQCPEYTETEKGKKIPISYETLFEALGFADADELAKDVDEYRRISSVFAT